LDTTSVAALLVAFPQLFEKTARYWLPLCATEGFVTVSVVLDAPLMPVQIPPLLVLICHWTPGAGEPLAAAENVALAPNVIDWLDGWVVTDGAVHAGAETVTLG
jgi:hypothetical protein